MQRAQALLPALGSCSPGAPVWASLRRSQPPRLSMFPRAPVWDSLSRSQPPLTRVQAPLLSRRLALQVIRAHKDDTLLLDSEWTAQFQQAADGLWFSNGKMVVPCDPVLRAQVICSLHDGPMHGHTGITKTYELSDLKADDACPKVKVLASRQSAHLPENLILGIYKCRHINILYPPM